MRGDEERQAGFIVMTTLEDVVPDEHPLRAIRAMVDAALEKMSPELAALYASGGRPSIAPEYLLRAQLIQILYAIPSERRLVEQLRYNLLLRWFVGLPLDEPRLPRDQLHEEPRTACSRLRSPRPSSKPSAPRPRRTSCSAASTSPWTAPCIEAAAALKSLRPIDEDEGEEPPTSGGGRNPDVDFRGAAPRQRQPPLGDRPRGPPRAQGPRQGGAALLRRPQPHREPPRSDRRRASSRRPAATAEREAGLRLAGAPAPPLRARAHERRRRQGLRQRRLRRRGARPARHPARGRARSAAAPSTDAPAATPATP